MLPKIKQPNRQKWLFERPIGNHGHVRTILGDFAEELTAILFRGQRFKTDSRCEYCPDVRSLDLADTYYECKTLGRTRGTFIYEGRLEKDRRFAESNSLFYCIWHHTLRTKDYTTVEELRAAFLLHLDSIYLVPFHGIYEIAQRYPRCRLNSKYGHSDTNPIYGTGVRLPLRDIQEAALCHLAWRLDTNA